MCEHNATRRDRQPHDHRSTGPATVITRVGSGGGDGGFAEVLVKDESSRLGLPSLPTREIVLHSNVADRDARRSLKALSAAIRATEVSAGDPRPKKRPAERLSPAA